MSDLRDAARQALEALEYHVEQTRPIWKTSQAIDALRAALEQPERAQAMRDAGYTRRPTLREMADPEQPEQEPVAWLDEEINCAYTPEELDGGSADGLLPLFTHPPRREWRGLTEEEIRLVFYDAREDKLKSCGDGSKHRLSVVEIARAIEAALKERNA